MCCSDLHVVCIYTFVYMAMGLLGIAWIWWHASWCKHTRLRNIFLISHILFSIIFCGCFYIFHMLNSHDRSCVISQHTFHTISHIFFTAFDDVKRRTSFHMVFTWRFHIIFHRCVKLYVKNQMKISHVLHMHFTSFLPVAICRL